MAYFKSTFGLIERLTITATTGGTLNLANNSRTYQQLTGTLAHTVVLPEANAASPNNCPLSLEFVIMNRSTGMVTVNYFGGSLAKTIAANSQATFRLVDNSTSTGTWDATSESNGGSGQATLSALEKLGALAALGTGLYQDSESVSSQIKVNPEEISGNFWKVLTPIAAAKAHMSAFDLKGYSYGVAGRNNGGTPQNTVERFNYDNNIWLSRGTVNTSRSAGYSTGDLVSKGYLCGGFTAGGTTSAVVEEYSEATNIWTALTSLPAAVQAPSGGFYNGMLYVAGGITTQAGPTLTSANYVYNTVTNAWYQRSSLIAARGDAGVFVTPKFMWTAGGQNAGGAIASVEYFQDVVNAWRSSVSIPEVKFYAPTFVSTGNGYMMSGRNASSAVTTSYRFDFDSNVWNLTAPSLSARGDASKSGAVSSGVGFAIGGDISGSATASVDGFIPFSYFTVPIVKKSLVVPTSVLTAAALNSQITDLPVRLRSDGDTWSYFEANKDSVLKADETLTAKFQTSGLVYVLGGNDSTGSSDLSSTEYYNPVSAAWVSRASLPAARAAYASAGIEGISYLFTGNNAVSSTTSYNEVTNAFTAKTATWSPTLYGAMGDQLNGLGYVFGGGGGGGASVATTKAYNATLDSITTKSGTLGTARQSASGWNLFGRLYAVAGQDAGGGSLNTSEGYDPTLDAWSARANIINSAKFLTTGAVVEGYGYVIGGLPSNVTERYNHSTNAFSVMTAMPDSNGNAISMRSGGLMYAMGGANGSVNTTIARSYNPLSNVWATLNSMTTARGKATANLAPGSYRNYELQIGLPTYLQAIGSYQFITRTSMNNNHSNGQGVGHVDGKSYTWDNSTGNSNASDAYNHETNVWTHWVTVPGGFSFSGGCFSGVLQGNGILGNGPSGVTYAALVQLGTFVNKSAATVNTRFRVLNSASYILNGYGWWYGGDQNNSSTLLNSIDQYNPDANNWTQRATSNGNSPRYCGGFNYNGLLYIIGGNDLSSYLSTVERYSDGSNTWTTRASYAFGVTGTSSTTYGGFPLAVGGYTGAISSSVYRYSDTLNTWTAQANFVGGGRENQATDNNTGLFYGGDAGVSADALVWKYIPAIQNVVLGAGLRIS